MKKSSYKHLLRLNDPGRSFSYLTANPSILKPEQRDKLENIISSNSGYSFYYSIHINRRFKKGEEAILNSARSGEYIKLIKKMNGT